MAQTPTAVPSQAPKPFPSTLWSQVLAGQDESPENRRSRMEKLIERYWRPVFWTFRSDGRATPEESADLTQEFFIEILEGGVLPGVDPERGSFRQYLKGALRNFLRAERRKTGSIKRGGGQKLYSLDAAGPEPPGLGTDPEKALDKAWGREILEQAVQDLEAALSRDGRGRDMEIFRTYDLSADTKPPSYADLAAQYGVRELDIWNTLRSCRRMLRSIVMEKIGPYVRNEEELFDELRELFGA